MSAPADVLQAARCGDELAFERLVGPYRAELVAHCYRMLGSRHDAEDAVQETLLRAWRSIAGLDERGFVKAWLYKIATNRCLTALSSATRRELPFDVTPETPVTEVSWLEPLPDPTPEASYLAREGIGLAFVAALQHLPPMPRAVLILRDVLAFPAVDVADQLDITRAAVNSALQRARKTMARLQHDDASRARQPDDMSHETQQLAARWVQAWQAGDVDAIVSMLADDARYCMPPLPEWYVGPQPIREFLVTGPLQSTWRLLPTIANAQLAFGTYLWDPAASAYLPCGLDVLSVDQGRVTQIVAFLTADLTDFALPATLPPS